MKNYERIKTNHRITEAERAEREKIVAELHKSDLTVFNQIDIFPLDGDDKKEFLEIFDTYTKNKKTSLPTKESLKYVIDQLAKDADEGTNDFVVSTIGFQAKGLDARSYRELLDYAFDEFVKANLFKYVEVEQMRELHIVMIYDFIIRHPEIVWTLQRISELRYKIRKRDDLESTGFLGF